MSEELRLGFLPYCLDQQPDGRYAVLNRRYLPLGMPPTRSEPVRPVDHPSLVRLPGLTTELARQLSYNGSPDLNRIYLYRSAARLTASDEAWADYSNRLRLLAALRAKR